nr:phage tail protein [uncultured Eisenbergiella sp.]
MEEMIMAYPFKKYNYSVRADGEIIGKFSEISSPEVLEAPIEYREGYVSADIAGRRQGIVKYGNIIMKWGEAVSGELKKWIQETEGGSIVRKTVEISLLDDTQREIAAWKVINAWPVKWSYSNRGTGNDGSTEADMSFESLGLSHEGFNREK